jgi:hypothetical protein
MNKRLRRDGEARNLSREKRKVMSIMRQIEETEEVSTFLRSLGTAECYQSATNQVLQRGLDVSVFFELYPNDLQGVCVFCQQTKCNLGLTT